MNLLFPAEKNYKILFERKINDLFLRRTEYMPGNWSGKHFHENARFVFVLQGNFTEKYERKERFCRPFTGIFRPPLEKHSEIYGPGVVCLSVDIAPVWLKNLRDHSVKLDKSNDFCSPSMTSLIRKISYELTLEDDVSSLAIDTLLTEIAVETHRSYSRQKSNKQPRWLKTAVEFIHEHYSDHLTLPEIAANADIHPVHLSRVFRQSYHLTIPEYIRRLRIESACRMLINSDLRVAQISAETGFSDQSHFTKIFKQLTGKTPFEFRKTHKNVH